MTRIIIALLLVVLCLQTIAPIARAQDAQGDIESKIKEYQRKLDETRQQKNTLSSQIQYMDTQTQLTTLKIEETGDKIISTQKEIETLNARIDGLDASLDKLSNQLLKRLVEGYKRRSITVVDFLLDSNSANDFINQSKYFKTAEENNQKILMQVQETKSNFQEQKELREKKAKQLDDLKNTLNVQKSNLETQKSQKTKLLADTKNDESNYQRLLADAQRQLSSFKSFVAVAGGGSIGANGFGSGSEGSYYSQRDSRWAGQAMGRSSDSVLEVGCLVTSISMALKRDGVNFTPGDIAANSSYFFSNTAYLTFPGASSWPGGKKYTNIGISTIENELSSGRAVIVGVYAGKYGTHYVMLIKKDGGDYIMHDPYYGPDKKFTDYYSTGSIFVAAVFR